MVARWASNEWRTYLHYVLFYLPVSPAGRVVMDFGCGCGLLAPLLLSLGCTRYVGADVISNMDEIRKLHELSGSQVSFAGVDEGYIDVQPEEIEIIVANEMISHVQPRDLPTVFSEWARVLKMGGVLFISDGNGLDIPAHWNVLLNLYAVIEGGPVGAPFGTPPFTSTVSSPYVDQRRAMITGWHPELDASEINYAAVNTAGLYCDRLKKVVDRYAQTKELTRRPYRMGQAPVVPSTGVVQELGFRPNQVVLNLMPHGFTCSARADYNRAPSAWTEDSTPRSFPASNFQVTAVKIA